MPVPSDILKSFSMGTIGFAPFFIDIVLLLSFVLLFVKRKSVFCNSCDVLSIDSSNKVRGLVAVLIVLHHLSQNIRSTLLFQAFGIIGMVCVAIFFFYSGYGLMINYLKRADYLKSFFRKRLSKILLPYFIAMVLTYFGYFLTNDKYTPKQIFNSLFDGNPFVRYSWYVITIVILYFVFFLAAKALKSPKKILIGVVIGTLFYCVFVTNKFSWGNWSVNSCFAFSFGIWAATRRELFKKLLIPQKISAVCLLLLILYGAGLVALQVFSGGFTLQAMMQFPDIVNGLMRRPLASVGMNGICIVGVVFCFWGFRKLCLNEKLFSFLGKISFELYLYHGLVMYLLRSPIFYCENDFLYLILVLSLTMLVAWLVHKATHVLLYYGPKVNSVVRV